MMSDVGPPPDFEFGTKEWDIEHLGLETTPLIRSCLDRSCSRFSFQFVVVFKGIFIDNNFAYSFDAESFTPHGAEVLEMIGRVWQMSRIPSTPGAGGSSASDGAGYSGHALRVPSEKLTFGTPQQSMVAQAKKRKAEVDSGEPYSSRADVGKSKEAAAKRLAAQELLMVLPTDCRANLCPGAASAEAMAVWLVLAIGNMGAVETLRNCRRQLAALTFWLERNYGCGPSFYIPPGVLLHFLATRLIGEGHSLHVPKNIRDGLIFAVRNLKLEIPVWDTVVANFCKVSHKLAQSAVSTSIAMFMRFFHFATHKYRGKFAYPFAVRYVATCLLVWCIVAIRSIDCQRAKILGLGPDGLATKVWMAAGCWDSKKKVAFVWLVPLMIFGNSEWVATLRAGWKTNDFMFCAFDCKRGAALAEMEDNPAIALDRPATPYMVQKWIRELLCMPCHPGEPFSCGNTPMENPLPPLMSADDAALTTRYGNRHLASNVARCADASKWPHEVKKAVSGWGSIKEMPDRYSQEAADTENYKIRVAILDVIQEAVERVGVSSLPAFGGWHLLGTALPSSNKSLTTADVVTEELRVGEEELAGSDVDDVSDDDDDDEELPSAPVRGRLKDVPDGWAAVSGNRKDGGTYIKHYFNASANKKLRSIKEITAFMAS